MYDIYIFQMLVKILENFIKYMYSGVGGFH